MALNAEQEEVISSIHRFIQTDEHDTFILKGYAGTGKTFLMQHLATELSTKKTAFSFLATTGRAATVLKGKTGFEARTIHGELYQFHEVDGDNKDIPADAATDAFGQMKLIFNLRARDDSKKIYIVDEASMVSTETNNEISYAEFGSGNLLQDLLSVVENNKIIFVGDPCQLPPVGQSASPALDEAYLKGIGRKVTSGELKTIVRTGSGNDILELAHNIRDMVGAEPTERWVKLPAGRKNNCTVHATEDALLLRYLEHFSAKGGRDCIAIAQSNAMCHKINEAVRQHLYNKPNAPLMVGDMLMITQNNYMVPLTNGDFAEVVSIGEPYTEAGLQFLEVKVKHQLTGKEYEVLLSLDVLYGSGTNLNKDQQRGLMINFSNRMRAKRIGPNTAAYKEQMKKDEYLNSLRATYGYAVTCHKSQGGEWDNVFLFLNKSMYGMPVNDMCRWWYTAVTRAKHSLHLGYDWWVV
jgi:ATP-dependent exoDNAse (exonuclease V) alpha subunit